MSHREVLRLVRRTHSNACTVAECLICFAVQQELPLLATVKLRELRPLTRDLQQTFQRIYSTDALAQERHKFQVGEEQVRQRLLTLLHRVHVKTCAVTACTVCEAVQQDHPLLAARALIERGGGIPAVLSLYIKLYSDFRLQQELQSLRRDPFQQLWELIYTTHFCEDNHCPVCAALKLQLPVAAAYQLLSTVELPVEVKTPIEEHLDATYTQARYLQELRALMDAQRTHCPSCDAILWVAPGAVCCDCCEVSFFWRGDVNAGKSSESPQQV